MIKTICPPKVSLIIPVYNVADCVSMCLDSCMEQTLRDLEVICVDDGSTDGSGDIADLYAQKDSRIRVIHKENGGLSSARNAGIRASSGQMIMFLDSDDYLQPWACARIWEETMQRPAEIIVFGSDIFPVYYQSGYWLWWTLSTKNAYYDHFVPSALFKERGAIPFVWRQAFHRDLLERSQVMFDETVRYGEDVIFQVEIFPFAQNISFIEDRAYCYRWQRKGSLMDVERKNADVMQQKLINVVDRTASFWRERKLMDRYGHQFLDWAMEYIVSGLKEGKIRDLSALAKEYMQVLEKHDLLKYKDHLSLKSKRRFHQLETMLK